MKLKAGDKVKLKNRRGKAWNSDGMMDKYIGKTVTISKVYRNDKSFYIDDNEGWMFDFDDIEYVVKQKHFKSLPNNYTGTIEVENGFIQEKGILDETEKRYLKSIIRPFKDKVEYIEKTYNSRGEYIGIKIIHDSTIVLPYFNENTMYEGMKVEKKYTLKELGLDV